MSDSPTRRVSIPLLAALLAAQRPVVIHADGGVGKSTLAAHLARAMPAGSVAILYDCFGDGTYQEYDPFL